MRDYAESAYFLDGQRVGEIPFTIEITFAVNAMVLKIEFDCVSKVRSGKLGCPRTGSAAARKCGPRNSAGLITRRVETSTSNLHSLKQTSYF